MKKIVSGLLVSPLLVASVALADDVVVIGNTAAGPLTKEQVADLYLGKSQGAKLVDQPNSAPVKATFYQKVSGHDLSQVKRAPGRA